jgi:hypothetical protein
LLNIAHIINPVNAPQGTELHQVQPMVFRSMQVAQAHANEATVCLLAVCFPEDETIVPPYFTLLPFLTRSVLNVEEIQATKKLPFIKDILEALAANTDAEYLIYTNADIILQPYFYQAVTSYVQQGHDALIINRRRIAPIYDSLDQLPLIWAQTGNPHPGYDCFVFHRSLLDKFVLGDVILGTPFIEATLAHNVFAHSQNYLLLDHHHLTAHLGMEVMPKRNEELYWHNRNAFFKTVLPALKPYLSDQKLPYASDSWLGKQVRRVLNPAIFTSLSVELEGKSKVEKLKWYLNELRWSFLGKR